MATELKRDPLNGRAGGREGRAAFMHDACCSLNNRILGRSIIEAAALIVPLMRTVQWL